MSTTITTLDGVDIRSAAVLARDCAFPITDLMKHVPQDEVFKNMPVFFGGWEDGTVAPAFRTIAYTVDSTLSAGDDCLSPIVKSTVTSCELSVPDMQEISFSTPVIKLRSLMLKFCRQRNIAPKTLIPFGADGNINDGSRLSLDFEKFALQNLYDVLSEQFLKSALVGDAANTNEFDGFYTQLLNGWVGHGSAPCPVTLNKQQIIDWGALCGKSAGVAAYPDDVVAASKTVTLWGVSYPVPAGINLAQFLNDLWIDKVNMEYADRFGGVTMWEAHVRWGEARTFLNTAACMRPCDGRDDDPEMRARLAEFRRTNIARLYPSGVSFPMLQSRHVAANTMHFGPRTIGDQPTYGMFIDDVEPYLTGRPMRPYGEFDYNGQDEYSFLNTDEWKASIETRGLYWSLDKKSAKCVQGTVLTYAGMLTAARHLWLKITNVSSPTLLNITGPTFTYVVPTP